MKRIIFFIWFFTISALASPQTEKNEGSITGIIVDSVSKQSLPFVNVIVGNTTKGAITDSKGKFIITGIPKGTYTLIISLMGYETSSLDKLQVENNLVDAGLIFIQEKPIGLAEVTVSPGSFSVMGAIPLSKQILAEKDIKNITWAEDITRVVARLPGISSNDFSSKFTVRGGENNEVLMNIDGMELYEPFHQRDFAGGLFSIVDIETVQGIDLLTGGFGAEYGNRLSGVFNMKTKHIADNQRNTVIGLSVMNARIYTDGTFAKNRGSYMITARRGMVDQTFKLIGLTESLPMFYDMMGKMEFKINPKHKISLHLLQTGDKTEIRDIAEKAYDIHDTKYSNTYAWLTLSSNYSSTLISKTIVYSGNITHNRHGDFQKYEYTDKNDFLLTDKRAYNFYGLKQDWNWRISEKFILKAGFDYKQLKSDYNYNYSLHDLRINSNDELINYENAFNIKMKPTGHQLGTYLTARFQLVPSLFLETGLRYDEASYSNNQFWSPRISFAYAFSKNTFLRGGWGYYYQSQFINNLDVNHDVSTFKPAQLSKHYVLGFEHLFANGLNFRVEGYYKDISHLSPVYQNLRDPWEVFPESRNDVVRLDMDAARSKGIEFFLKYDVGKKISWWLSYALAKAEDNVVNIDFDGQLTKRTGWTPMINNQNHTIYCDLNYRPNSKWYFNTSWQFYTGWPRTTYDYDFKVLENGDIHFYQVHKEFAGEKYPAYHRMDVRANRHFETNLGQITAFIHIINLYNRENLRKFDLDVTGDNDQLIPDGKGGYIYPRDDKYWFGITPVIGMSWKF